MVTEIPDIMAIIYSFVGNQNFMSLDQYENVLSEYKMIYNPGIIEMLFQFSVTVDADT